jgi:menaquinone-9 beta-reductase
LKDSHEFDAIIVGARAAGAATAMLLARRGLRVLALERAQYGGDTISTHALMRPAVLQLRRWGLLDRVREAGTPPVRRVTFRYPDEIVAVDLPSSDGVDALFAPRRTVLDRILVDAARESGARIAFGVSVESLQHDSAGRVTGVIARDAAGHTFSLRARMVIGADGFRSLVARQAGAEITRSSKVEGAVLFAYFSGIDTSGYEWGYAPGMSAGFIPTNDGEVCVFVGCSTERFRGEVQPDLHRGFRSILERVSSDMSLRVASARQTGQFRGFAAVSGFYRKPFGPGWALVGDAGLFRDPITTHGIADAFRDAELLARAMTGAESLETYEITRDTVSRDLFDVTERIAAYDWSMDEIRLHLREVSRAMKPELRLLLGWDAAEAA